MASDLKALIDRKTGLTFTGQTRDDLMRDVLDNTLLGNTRAATAASVQLHVDERAKLLHSMVEAGFTKAQMAKLVHAPTPTTRVDLLDDPFKSLQEIEDENGW